MKKTFKILSLSMVAFMLMTMICGCGDGSNVTSTTGKPGFPDYLSSGTEGDFEYDQYKSYITITKYIGKDVDVTVPDKIKDTPVTTIEDRAFANDSNKSIIHSVTLPNTISNLDTSSFYNSRFLENIQISPDNKSYKSVDGVLYSYDMKQLVGFPENSSITEFTVPEGVTTIDNSRFAF